MLFLKLCTDRYLEDYIETVRAEPASYIAAIDTQHRKEVEELIASQTEQGAQT